MKQKFDQVLDQALAMYDEGKTADQILAAFPNHTDELSEILKVITTLEQNRDQFTPAQHQLREVVNNLPAKKIRRPWRLAWTLPALATLALGGLVAYNRYLVPSVTSPVTPIAATGKVDDAAASLAKEATSDESFAELNDQDDEILAADQAAAEMEGAFDENEF